MLIFTNGGKPENPEKSLIVKERTMHQINSIHMIQSEQWCKPGPLWREVSGNHSATHKCDHMTLPIEHYRKK